MTGIIGLIEICGSMIYKISGDAHPHSGMGKYESKEIFQSYKASCMPADAEAVQRELFALAERDVMAAADYHANYTQRPKPEVVKYEPEPVQQTAQPSAQPQTESQPEPESKYVVSEKPAEQPAPTPITSAKAPLPSKVIADRLKALGVTSMELSQWLKVAYPDHAGAKYTQEQYVHAFTYAEDMIKKQSIDAFRQCLAPDIPIVAPTAASPASAPPQTPEPLPTGDIFKDDPAVREAMKQVQARWPMWGPELVRLASLWCADQVKDALALEAFLISCGVNGTTAPTRIESLLAITRHMALSQGAVLIDFCKRSGNPLSMIEADLEKALGKPLRFAMDLAPDAVLVAFTELAKKGK